MATLSARAYQKEGQRSDEPSSDRVVFLWRGDDDPRVRELLEPLTSPRRIARDLHACQEKGRIKILARR
jgi:hypothetical protein